MKKVPIITYIALIVSIIALCVAFYSEFHVSSNANHKQTIQWLEHAKRPIICKRSQHIFRSTESFTLIDCTGAIFYTGDVDMIFPDTIKY